MSTQARGRAGNFRKGWRDYQSGKPFAADYETWLPMQQLDYERGRRAAAVASRYGMHATWTAFRTAPLPRGVRAVALREIR